VAGGDGGRGKGGGGGGGAGGGGVGGIAEIPATSPMIAKSSNDPIKTTISG
jgi:hypothetical protein